MGLKIYTEPNSSSSISSNDTFTKPLLVAMDGKTGGVVQKRLYLRNDDNSRSFQNIQIRPSSNYLPFIDGSVGMSFKLYPGDTKPIEEQWNLTADANTISLSDLGTVFVTDITTYLPFWVRVEIPRSIDVQTIKDVKLEVTGTESLV